MGFNLRDLYTVAQFIKSRCGDGLKAAEVKKDKNYVFFEVEILDSKKLQLCFLDKVSDSLSIFHPDHCESLFMFITFRDT